MSVVALDVGIVGGADLVEGAFPKVEGEGQHIGLAAQRQGIVLVAPLSVFEGVAQAALDALAGIDRLLGRDLVGRTLFQEAASPGVDALGIFAHYHEVDVLWPLVGERRRYVGIELDRAQVDVLVQLETQPEQNTLFEDTGLDVGVPDRAEVYRVEGAEIVCRRIGQHLARLEVAIAAEVKIDGLELEALLGGDGFQGFQPFNHDFRTGAVPGQYGDLIHESYPSLKALV